MEIMGKIFKLFININPVSKVVNILSGCAPFANFMRFRSQWVVRAIIFGIFILPHSVHLVWAGTVFLAPPSPKDANVRQLDKEYPESRFGYQPAPAFKTGTESDYPSRIVSEVGQATPGRGPASYSAKGPSEDSSPGPMDMVRSQGMQELAVIANDLGFFPKTLFVTRDIPVRLFVTGASQNSLCIMMDTFQIRKQVRPQKVEEITFTPTLPGKYRFYCPMNGMEGSLIVRELASSE